uniref:Transposase n=1 Tax=Panagrolaimus sp. JU765 TaxID=591449 RepID=A0AC34QNR8_9BILA
MEIRGSKYCTKKELIEAMKYAGRFGVAEAARKFNIPPQHLTYWYRKYAENIDRDLIDHIIEYKRTHQSDHLAGYTLYVLIKQFLQKKYPGTLYEDGGWVSLKDRWIDGFLQRIADRERSLISDEQILRQMNQMNQLPLLLLAAELLKAQNQSHENERQS